MSDPVGDTKYESRGYVAAPYQSDPDLELVSCSRCGAAVVSHWAYQDVDTHTRWHALLDAALPGLVEAQHEETA